jgi:hypothetical protein
MNRAEVIASIRENLRQRSGKAWSVTGGRGTGWGWLTIDAPPARRTWRHEITGEAFPDGPNGRPVPLEERSAYFNDQPPGRGYTGLAERCELAALLDLSAPVHCQGVSVPPDSWNVYARKATGEAGVYEPEHNWD